MPLIRKAVLIYSVFPESEHQSTLLEQSSVLEHSKERDRNSSDYKASSWARVAESVQAGWQLGSKPLEGSRLSRR